MTRSAEAQSTEIGSAENSRGLAKAPSGITGLDEITRGGLPRGRPTLICGGPGCGKTLMSIEFLVRGATEFDEPGVFMSFEETSEELAENVRSLGFDLDDLVEQGRLALDFVRVERQEIEETGDYDLEGLFIRLGFAIDRIGAKRVVLDTLETLFGGFSNEALLRAELRRLFRWLKDRGVTAVITGERGDGSLTRQGLEEYVSDCVMLLDHRITEQVSTRRLRVVKYRGTSHGADEYPFLINEDGISVLPITSAGLEHVVSEERISTGIPDLDSMMGGQGYYRGSTVLVSGTAGSGKSSVAAHFASAACERGERCLYLSFEESPAQIVRNMKAIGLDLQQCVDDGNLRFHSARSTMYGLEMHLATLHKLVEEFQPHVVVLDPVTNLMHVGSGRDVNAMLSRTIDFLKMRGITAMLLSLTSGNESLESTGVDVSSVSDTWLLLRDIELGGERNRGMYILKSRGMAHSNQIREFLLTSHGIELVEVYTGPEGVLTGSARLAQEARERATAQTRRLDAERRQRRIEREREVMEARIAAMRAELEAEEQEMAQTDREAQQIEKIVHADREAMRRSRRAASSGNGPPSGPGRKGKPHD